MGGFAWVTLATNDSYALGALVLAYSLKRVNTAHQLAIMITPGVSEAMRTQLSAVFNVVKVVDVLDSQDQENLALLARPELGITFTKLHCWKLTQFDKCVFLDADTLVLQNSDELFDREELSAAPDIGWPDCFNSGVYVFKPSEKTFQDLIDFALVHGTFDGGDQGLLNLYFSDWATKDITKHLPFIYNVVSSVTYTYLPALKQFQDRLKIVHFIGSSKPWLQPFDTETGFARVHGDAQSQSLFIQLWWDIFCAYVHPTLTTEMAGLAGALSTIKLGAPLGDEENTHALHDHLRKQGWEEGRMDYMGKDSFDNIWRKICETVSSNTVVPSTSQTKHTSDPTETVKSTQPNLESTGQQKVSAAPSETAPSEPSCEPQKEPIAQATTKTVSEQQIKAESIIQAPPQSKPPHSPIELGKRSPVADLALQPLPSATCILTPPQSPQQTQPPKVPEAPATPTVTTPTPPTSPPAVPLHLPTTIAKLSVETEMPATPPASQTPAHPLTAAAASSEPPVPPKRKGGKGGAHSGQGEQSGGKQQQQHQKGGKGGKGKK